MIQLTFRNVFVRGVYHLRVSNENIPASMVVNFLTVLRRCAICLTGISHLQQDLLKAFASKLWFQGTQGLHWRVHVDVKPLIPHTVASRLDATRCRFMCSPLFAESNDYLGDESSPFWAFCQKQTARPNTTALVHS